MANELQAQTTTGLTLYAVLVNSTGQAWNGSAWETLAGANWLTYDLAMTEAAAGIYLASMPVVAAGAYSYVVYERAGVNPAITDDLVGAGSIQWDGTAELALSTIEAQTDDIGTAGAGLTAIPTIAAVTTVGSVTGLTASNLDATVSSRSTLTAADVWTYATRTLTSLSALVSSIAVAVWAYVTRTLTQSSAAVAAALAGSTITIQRGDTTSIAFTALGAITGQTQVWFAIKSSTDDADTASIVLITRTGGLIYLNGAAPVAPITTADGALVVSDEATGALTVTLSAAMTAQLAARGSMAYDVQYKGSDSHIHTLTTGTASVSGDVTRAVV